MYQTPVERLFLSCCDPERDRNYPGPFLAALLWEACRSIGSYGPAFPAAGRWPRRGWRRLMHLDSTMPVGASARQNLSKAIPRPSVSGSFDEASLLPSAGPIGRRRCSRLDTAAASAAVCRRRFGISDTCSGSRCWCDAIHPPGW